MNFPFSISVMPNPFSEPLTSKLFSRRLLKNGMKVFLVIKKTTIRIPRKDMIDGDIKIKYG